MNKNNDPWELLRKARKELARHQFNQESPACVLCGGESGFDVGRRCPESHDYILAADIDAALAEHDSATDAVEWSWGPFGASRETTVNRWDIEVFYNWVNPTHSEWTAYLRRTGESEEELMQAAITAARGLK